MKFEVFKIKNTKTTNHKTKSSEWYFRVVAANGKVLAHSEAYTRKRYAVEAVAIIKAGAPVAKTVVAA